MRTITIRTSTTYDVQIGPGLLDRIGEAAAFFAGAKRVCIVSDSNVWPLYGPKTAMCLRAAGLDALCYVFQAGENSKSFSEYLKLVNFLADNSLTRSDLLIALGGGVVGDLCGFAAATYLRGVRLIQVPTTLLAAVDSSVGGKTAINLAAGKNLCGAFYQPSLVLCDIDTMQTLPKDIFLEGCSEVIKYGILYDESFFRYLQVNGLDFDLETVISRCVELKRDVVARDELDRDERMLLNLGHTIAHGIEGASNYQISHGVAVAMGIGIVSRASHCVDRDRILACLRKFSLPVTTDISPAQICHYALSDKKRSADTVTLIIPNRIGDCTAKQFPVSEIQSFIEEGL